MNLALRYAPLYRTRVVRVSIATTCLDAHAAYPLGLKCQPRCEDIPAYIRWPNPNFVSFFICNRLSLIHTNPEHSSPHLFRTFKAHSSPYANRLQPCSSSSTFSRRSSVRARTHNQPIVAPLPRLTDAVRQSRNQVQHRPATPQSHQASRANTMSIVLGTKKLREISTGRTASPRPPTSATSLHPRSSKGIDGFGPIHRTSAVRSVSGCHQGPTARTRRSPPTGTAACMESSNRWLEHAPTNLQVGKTPAPSISGYCPTRLNPGWQSIHCIRHMLLPRSN